MDWYKAHTGKEYSGEDDPGVQSVRSIYNYYKKFDYSTEVMGASFRNIGEILALAGCDLLTIGPKFLEELQRTDTPVQRKLSPLGSKDLTIEQSVLDESAFRYQLNANAMATEKLAEGIRLFSSDIEKLEEMICKEGR